MWQWVQGLEPVDAEVIGECLSAVPESDADLSWQV